jgi:putative sterol carrier protein
MAQYPFLSPEWTAEAEKIREEFAGQATPPAQSLRMNLVVTDVPFGEGTMQAHLDTSSGQPALNEGHLETADVKITVDYLTAKAILVEGNPQAGMQAFMAGKIKVEGDMAKLLALQTAPADPVAAQVATRMREITAA